MTCYITIGEESNVFRLLKLEPDKHPFKVLSVHCVKLGVEGLKFNNIGLALMNGGIDLYTFCLTIQLIVCDLIGPVFTTDGCI